MNHLQLLHQVLAYLEHSYDLKRHFFYSHICFEIVSKLYHYWKRPQVSLKKIVKIGLFFFFARDRKRAELRIGNHNSARVAHGWNQIFQFLLFGLNLDILVDLELVVVHFVHLCKF